MIQTSEMKGRNIGIFKKCNHSFLQLRVPIYKLFLYYLIDNKQLLVYYFLRKYSLLTQNNWDKINCSYTCLIKKNQAYLSHNNKRQWGRISLGLYLLKEIVINYIFQTWPPPYIFHLLFSSHVKFNPSPIECELALVTFSTK